MDEDNISGQCGQGDRKVCFNRSLVPDIKVRFLVPIAQKLGSAISEMISDIL